MLDSTKNNGFSMSTVLVSLGANLGDAEQTLVDAVATLEARGRVTALRLSRLYRTRPVGPILQADFVNGAFLAKTPCSPGELLAELLAVERLFGRQRQERWGPRSLDLDLLFYDDQVLCLPELTLPHAEVEARGFVLAPLMDLAPEWRHPVSGRSVRESWERWRASQDEDDRERAVRPLPGTAPGARAGVAK